MDNSRRPLKPDFVLNQPRYRGAQILLARRSATEVLAREHAPWALLQYGFQAVIAPSFADIFFNNSFKNGLLLIRLDKAVVDRLFKETESTPGYRLAVDLENQSVTTPAGEVIKFDIDPFRKHCLMNGLDEIGLTLEHADKIRAFEAKRRSEQPWLFNEVGGQA
jgi:3-isopropylmalate/(R)-2-methylmalate dehydratase small subunit